MRGSAEYRVKSRNWSQRTSRSRFARLTARATPRALDEVGAYFSLRTGASITGVAELVRLQSELSRVRLPQPLIDTPVLSARGVGHAVKRCVATVISVLCLVTASAFGQVQPASERLIEIEQSSNQPPVGMGRPIPTWWDVNIKSKSLVTGRFEFVLRHEGKVLATLTTEELALTGPQQRIRVVLPPVNDPNEIDQLLVDVTFRGQRFTEQVGRHVLRVARMPAPTRTFVALTATARLSPKRSLERDRVQKRLALESLAVADLEGKAQTVFASLEPPDLPQEPLAYCAYELVVLFGDEFRALKKPQLEALAAWVRAGGSVYVEPTGVLEPYHVEFLRTLTATDARGLVFQPDSKGKLVPGTIGDEGSLFTTTIGLGRAVIRVEEESAITDFESEPWRRATAALWRLREEQRESIVKTGKFASVVSPFLRLLQAQGGLPNGTILGVESGPSGTVAVRIDTNGDGQSDTNIVVQDASGQARGGSLGLKLVTSTSELLERLMPSGVRMVPLWLLGGLLFGFVVVIGPVDYIGLGWLKARKFTWVTFPAATILVTALTVWISNSYMTTAEARRALVLRDVGEDGSVVRTNRFELLFLSSSRAVQSAVKKGTFSPLATTTAMDALYQQYGQYNVATIQCGQRQGYDPSGQRPSAAARLAGRIPVEYTATQDLAKWTPQLNRTFSIPGLVEESVVDWKGLAEGQITRAILDSHLIPQELAMRVRSQFGSAALVACFGPKGTWSYDRQPAWWTNRDQSVQDRNGVALGSRVYRVNARRAAMAAPDYAGIQLPADIQQQADLFRWLYQHSVAMPRGIFGLVSAVGPQGGSDLDDLPIYDPTDPTHALLIVVMPRGDDLHVYRKLVPCAE